jgi:uncharacterized protein YuzE
MDKTNPLDHLTARYDAEQDILYLMFSGEAREAIAEEAGDDIFVRFDPDTYEIVDIEFLNFSARLQEAFGPQIKYLSSGREERVLPLPGESKD